MAEHASIPVALLSFAVVLAAAAGCGMAVLRALRIDTDAPTEQFVMGSAIGLGLLAYSILAVGLLGCLRPPILFALVLLEGAVGGPAFLAWARCVRDRIDHGGAETRSSGAHRTARERAAVGQDDPSDTTSPAVRPSAPYSPRLRASVAQRAPQYTALALVLACLFLAAVTLAGVLAPPTGDDWDSLTYHLAAPKIYLAHHRIFFIPYDSHTNFPFTMEMLYTLGLAYGGAAGAKLFHWAAAWLTALGIAAFCRRLSSTPGGVLMPVWVPPLAGALFLGIPQVQWQATTAYIDLGTALYQFLALAAFVYGVTGPDRSADEIDEDLSVDRDTGASPALTPPPALAGGGVRARPHGWLIVSGLMSGWAMGTKMTALLPFGFLVLAGVLWAAFRARSSKPRPASDADALASSTRWPAVAGLVATGILVASPWYVKSYLWTHNPVYPFFYSLFPHSVGWTREAESAYQHEQQLFGLGQGMKALLMVPWNLAMQGWAYFTVPTRQSPPGTFPYFDGLRRGGLSATFLALIPLALFTRCWDRRLTGLIIYALALLLPWFALSQQSRYLLPIAAPLAVAAAAVAANLEADLPRMAAGVFVGLVLFLHVGWGWSEILARSWPVVSGQASQNEYLQRTFGPYDAMVYLNRLPANTKVAMYQETRGFYLNRDYLWANPLQNTLVPYERLKNGADLVWFLKTRLGVTHVLINQAGVDEITRKTTWYRLLKDAIDHNDLVPVFAANEVEVYAIP
jgi:hypothetical protein